MLETHYDPANRRSIEARCDAHGAPVVTISIEGVDDGAFALAALDGLLAPLMAGEGGGVTEGGGEAVAGVVGVLEDPVGAGRAGEEGESWGSSWEEKEEMWVQERAELTRVVGELRRRVDELEEERRAEAELLREAMQQQRALDKGSEQALDAARVRVKELLAENRRLRGESVEGQAGLEVPGSCGDGEGGD